LFEAPQAWARASRELQAMPSGSDESPTSSMGSQVSSSHQSDNGPAEST
jgi:hypothetical protein